MKSVPEPTDPGTWFVGVDVGGTNIKLGIIASDGSVIGSTSFPTQQARGPEFALTESARHLDQLLSAARAAGKRGELVAAGLGTPGPMDVRRGLILEPTNLPGWRHFPVRDRLAETLGLPVTYANDANAAAWGEFWVGGGASHDSLVLLTLGTGVGGGIIVGNMLVEGAHGLGGELGHLTIDTCSGARICSCGLPGHLEAYASATGLVARCRDGLAGGRRSPAIESAGSALDPRVIAEAAAAGDAFALRLVGETADWLARGIALLVHAIDPDCFLLGGAMTFGALESPVGRMFLERVRQKSAEMVFPVVAADLKIGFAKLGGEAGWIGAAGLARRDWMLLRPVS